MLTLAVIILFMGAVLLTLEILVIPGFGLFGVTGLVLVAVGLGIVMAAPGISGTIALMIAMALMVICLILFAVFIRRHQPSTLVLSERLSGSAAQANLDQLQGSKGVALTQLRPTGTAELEGKRWTVVTEGEYIAAGAAVDVIRVEGQRIIVRGRNN